MDQAARRPQRSRLFVFSSSPTSPGSLSLARHPRRPCGFFPGQIFQFPTWLAAECHEKTLECFQDKVGNGQVETE